METHEHPLSWRALGRIVAVGIIILFAWKALTAVIDIIVALVFTASLYPLVLIVRKKMHTSMLISTIIIFILLCIPFILFGFIIAPTLSTQIPELLIKINAAVGQSSFIGSLVHNFDIIQYIKSHSEYILASSGSIIFTTFSIIATIILTFYFVYDYDRLLKLSLDIFPNKDRAKLNDLIETVSKVIGQYIRGNIIISCITFFVLFIGLSLLQVPFALLLAFFAGVIDLLPLVGSTLGAIPALLVAFSISPTLGFLVLVLYIVYQQIENAFISPIIYNKTLNLYPALGFLAVLVGASLFGILGAFLALPIAASIPAIIEYHENYKQRHQTSN